MFNSPERVGMRTTLAFITLYGLAACAPSTPEAVKPTPIPIASSTPLPEPTPTEIKATQIPISNDGQNQLLIEQAKDGEVITLRHGLVSHVIRIPWIPSSAYVATLSTNLSSRAGVNLVMNQADCIYDAFKAAQTLGFQTGGGWKPEERVEAIDVRIKIPVSVAAPVPFGDAQKITYKGRSYNCHQETLGGELRDLLRKVNWKNMPEDIGSVLGNTARQFIDGVRRGLKPSPVN